jgi:hypothetical protein
VALGPAPWSVLATHNSVLTEIRKAFAFGAYYRRSWEPSDSANESSTSSCLNSKKISTITR